MSWIPARKAAVFAGAVLAAVTLVSDGVTQPGCKDIFAAENALERCRTAASNGRCKEAVAACQAATSACMALPKFKKKLDSVVTSCRAPDTPTAKTATLAAKGAVCKASAECASGLTCKRRVCTPARGVAKTIARYQRNAVKLTAQSPCDARELLELACAMATHVGESDLETKVRAQLKGAEDSCPHYRGPWCDGPSSSVGPMVPVPAGPYARGTSDEGISRGLAICKQTYTAPNECNKAWFARESPRRTLTIDAFEIDRMEVTNTQYAACVSDGKCPRIPYEACNLYDSATGRWVRGGKPHADIMRPDHPVVCTAWSDAVSYCGWAGKRLPTEAEWEKAARGDDAREFPWGNDWRAKHLNWGETTGFGTQDTFETTAPVGTFPQAASPYGALDMSGNAWEWTADWHGDDYYTKSPAANPQNTVAGKARVMRGGSWSFAGNGARVAYRYFAKPDMRDDAVGFRCAR